VTDYDAAMAARAASDPRTKGLARAPTDVRNAVKGVVYWHVTGQSGNGRAPHTPYRAVRSGDTKYDTACQTDGCASLACASCKGGVATFCVPCGGGCPHRCRWLVCRECNPDITKQMNCCSNCGGRIAPKRYRSKGGNGLCPMCEEKRTTEAAEAGTAPPPKSKRWEDVVLDDLVVRIVDVNGVRISPEMRDDFKHMIGSLRKRAGVRASKRKRKRGDDDENADASGTGGECDTTTKRRPDLLYVVRDEQGYIVAAVFVEVDEHSHMYYDVDCELGKVDDTFQAILALAQTEGKARLAITRTGEVQTPYVHILKFNPNACDASDAPIRLDTRIAVLAKHVNDVLRTPLSEFRRRAAAHECDIPHVQALYYHSQHGGRILAHFDDKATTAWDWRGNACPTSVDDA
jgi:hypothetical protein